MKHFLLIYDTAPGYQGRRAEFRDAHLALAWAAADRGELILGGALGDPVDGAALLFKAPSPRVADGGGGGCGRAVETTIRRVMSACPGNDEPKSFRVYEAN